MARKRGLGRGLKALISVPPRQEDGGAATGADAAPVTAPGLPGEPNTLPLGDIVPSPWQPRTEFDPEKLQALTDSIREQGLIQPLVVRRRVDGQYELIAGERRLRAVKRLGWETVPAVVMEASDARMRELALVENLQRDDLNPLEVALSYHALQQDAGMTHGEIASRLGVSRAQITNTLRLLDLPDPVKEMVVGGEIRAGHARAILGLPQSREQIHLARKVVKDGLSVRATETLVSKKMTDEDVAPGTDKKVPTAKDPHLVDLEDRLRGYLGTKVTLHDTNGRGAIRIEYYSADDATRILERLGLPDEG